MEPSNDKRQLTILCAADDDSLRTALVDLLTHNGHVVDAVTNGFEAWEKVIVNLSRYDVLVTDHDLPVLTGLELVELLHAVKYPGRMLAHSTGVSVQDRERYHAFGVEKMIMKASQSSEILDALNVVPVR